MRWQIFLKSILLIELALMAGCATNPVTGESDFVLMSESKELEMGKLFHPKVLSEYGVYNDPVLQAYVQQIGDQLAAKSHRNDLIFRFTVLDSPVVNAFALPGGYIYITRGIMAYLNSEAELAGVLGHEIGHVTARHGVKQHAASTTASIFGSVVAYKTGSRASTELFNLFGGALISGYGRKHELESDQLGAEYLAHVGYNPKTMLSVIGVLKNQEEFARHRANEEGREPQAYHGLFASHPNNDTRLQEVIAAAEQYRIQHYRDDHHDQYLNMIDGMIYGHSEQQGITRNGVFYHPILKISFTLPNSWRIDNLPNKLILGNKTNDALMQVTVEDLNKRVSPEVYLKTLLDVAKPLGEKSFKINNFDAYTLLTQKKYPFGKRKTRFTVIFKSNRAYLFWGVAKNANKFDEYDTLFIETARTFHQMSEDELAIAKPYRIKLIQATEITRFEDLANQSTLPNYAESYLRLINAQYPNGQPKVGSWIKIIE